MEIADVYNYALTAVTTISPVRMFCLIPLLIPYPVYSWESRGFSVHSGTTGDEVHESITLVDLSFIRCIVLVFIPIQL